MSLLLAVFCSHYFYEGYGAHRDLHSFPTRRSSDLGPRRRARRLVVSGSHGETPAWRPCRPTRTARPRRGDRRAASDRKSTRLNSSHVAISYAVFCLKKKKQQTIIVGQKTRAGWLCR